MQKIIIIDYGMGNLRSVHNKLNSLGVVCTVTSNKGDLLSADKIVLPGVGHFATGMKNLHKLGLLDTMNKRVLEDGIPVMGICLGVQLFASHSEEGNCTGLGWIDAEVVRFHVSDTLTYKIPHIGWNSVRVNDLYSGDSLRYNAEYFYFVHSYHLQCNDPSNVWMCSDYDYEFVSAVRKNNIWGTQFHPEKSHDIGAALLKQFIEL